MIDKKNKKVFMIPDAEIVSLANEDIITLSAADAEGRIGDGENEETYVA